MAKCCDFLDIILTSAMLLICEDEVSYYIITVVLRSSLGSCLEETVLLFSSQGLIGDSLDDFRSLDADQLSFLEPGGLFWHASRGDIDEADEVPELHAFVVVLEQDLAGFLLVRDDH